ncbi:hypothetical protein PR048_011265 [Dryococelus australis]|uniref:Uncharacterized protein n=1 Tax=Dryococelus australis TaxID=614101 RepID=A0ABQ9HLN0_9NEOP|nr:hypothetical protein PR048_011265 [Dryococelus australis]
MCVCRCEGTAGDMRPAECQHALGITEPCRVRRTLPRYGPWLPRRPLQGRHLSLQEHCDNDLSLDITTHLPASSRLHSLPAGVGQPNYITSLYSHATCSVALP